MAIKMYEMQFQSKGDVIHVDLVLGSNATDHDFHNHCVSLYTNGT